MQIKDEPRKKLIVALRNFVIDNHLQDLKNNQEYNLSINFSINKKNNSIHENGIYLMEALTKEQNPTK